MTPFSIVLIDRYPIMKIGLRLVLDQYFPGTLLIESDTVNLFRDSWPEFEPDIFILAVGQSSGNRREGSGDVDDIKAIQLLRDLYPTGKIVVSDQANNWQMIKAYLASGALGYIAKKCDILDLIDCLRQVTAGIRYVSNETLMKIEERLHARQNLIKHAITEGKALTKRQHEVAMYLADGMSTRGIANVLNIRQSSVSAMKTKIYRKLEVNSVTDLRKLVLQA